MSVSDPRIALEWIKMIESDRARVRERDIYPLLRAWFAQVAPQALLEIGAGQGACSAQLNLEGCRYTGLELSPLLVDRARELYARESVRFVVGNAEQLPFEDGSFDAAYSVAVWHLLPDFAQAARELARVLKSGGHFFAITANPEAYPLWTGLYESGELQGKRFEGKTRLADQALLSEVLHLHSRKELEDALATAGLEVLHQETFRPSEKTPGLAQFLLMRGRKR